MKLIRKYVDQKSFINLFVRLALNKDSNYAYVTHSSPDLIQVTSVLYDGFELNSAIEPLKPDYIGFSWLRQHPSAKSCVVVCVKSNSNNKKIDVTVADVDLICINNGKITDELTGRFDDVIGFAVAKCESLGATMVLEGGYNWSIVPLYLNHIKESNIVFDEFVEDDNSEALLEFTPKPIAAVRKTFKRTAIEYTIIGGVILAILGGSVGYYFKDSMNGVIKKEEVITRTEDPYREYRNSISGNHVDYVLNFALSKLGEYKDLKNWHNNGIKIADNGKFSISFEPDYKAAALTDVFQWMRLNSKDKMEYKDGRFSVSGEMPKQTDHYMDSFKRYIIDAEINYAELVDLGRYAGFNRISAVFNKRSNFMIISGDITATVTASQMRSFYDQLAALPMQSKAFSLKQDRSTGLYSIRQKYKLTGGLPNSKKQSLGNLEQGVADHG